MKKKIAGKLGAFLMIATMTFSGATVAFADDASDDQAVVEQNQDETLDTAKSRVLESGAGYTIEKGKSYSTKNKQVTIIINTNRINTNLNTLIAELVDKDSVGTGSTLSITNYENSSFTISKSNLEKIKNKGIILETEDMDTDISYTIYEIDNTSTDFSATMSVNTDTAAMNKIKSAGISRFLAFTTSGKAGSAMPGTSVVRFERYVTEEPDFDFPQKLSSRDQYLYGGEDLFGYYYNAAAGRFEELFTSNESGDFDVKVSAGIGAHGMACITKASAFYAKYHGTYVVTQGKLPESVLMSSYTGLVNEKGSWLYYKNGAADASYTGLCKYNGSWWYVKNGKVDFSASGLCKYNNAWWYLNGGRVNFSATGLCKYNGTWWYVKNGKVDFGSATLCRYNGTWWYVSGGKVNFNATGLCKYNGAWWYVKNGKVDFGTTGLCKYNGAWWYVKGGQVSFTTTLCKYNGIWWYINNGAVNFNKTTLVKYGSNWYAVAGGKVAWNYTGKIAYNGRYFNVVKGVVKF